MGLARLSFGDPQLRRPFWGPKVIPVGISAEVSGVKERKLLPSASSVLSMIYDAVACCAQEALQEKLVILPGLRAPLFAINRFTQTRNGDSS